MKQKTAIVPTRAQNYALWYQQVIKAAALAEHAPVRGCMVIKPWGYAIWEQMQRILDARLKATGHQNAYFPLLIPLSHLEKEAQHVSEFAKECAVVTHHRLVAKDHKLKPDGLLEEPFIIRPTSETVIGTVFAKWVESYKDLPLLINQWANVMRWEMRTRLFLRTSEFLWQEGHTVHATAQEAQKETRDMLHLYADFMQNVLAIPVILGEKTQAERFPGAVATYSLEAMMQDGRALQAGTSHFLGQNFSKAYQIQFTTQTGEKAYGWTTSWGVSTRLIGGLIMTHSDDNGLVLPPRLAPHQVVILPICRPNQNTDAIQGLCEQIAQTLRDLPCFGRAIAVHIDRRDLPGGEKKWRWIKKGVPILLEIGQRECTQACIPLLRRDSLSTTAYPLAQLPQTVADTLQAIQSGLFLNAQARQKAQTVCVTDAESFKHAFAARGDESTGHPFVLAFAKDDPDLADRIKALKITARCMPLDAPQESGTCIFTGIPTYCKILFAKAY